MISRVLLNNLRLVCAGKNANKVLRGESNQDYIPAVRNDSLEEQRNQSVEKRREEL